MDSFRTTFKIPESELKIDYPTRIISLGSCFSENIGEKLTRAKFQAVINPFGILYNPESIAHSLEFIQTNKTFNETEIFKHQGIWNSFYHHSRFSSTNKQACLTGINNSLNQASEFMKNTQYLLITFGTAWVYKLKSTGKIVSNCHKIPAGEFTRYKLSVSDIVKRYTSIIKMLQTANTGINIVFTVSPVRHLKDGADQNQISKATLILAVHELVNAFKNVSYFPSYELMIDDLRDYRFYNEDMTHPSPAAINYIWEKFRDAYISSEAQKLMQEIEQIERDLNHRPFQPESESYKKFLASILNKINKIENQNPMIDFEREKDFLLKKQ